MPAPTADGRATYPPLDTPKPFAENVWIVDSSPLGIPGLPLPVRMTVIRLASGDVWLHSPTRFSFDLRAAIDRIGPIRHLVAPNVAHWTFLEQWQAHCPDALTWAAPGLRDRGQVRRSGVRLDTDLGDRAPEAWEGEIDQKVVPGGLGFREVACFHRPSRTLLLTDLVLNLEAAKLPPPARALMRLAGTLAPDGRAPAHLRAVVRLRRRDAALAAAQLVAWAPERVIVTHGAPIERDAAARLRHSLRWLLGPDRCAPHRG